MRPPSWNELFFNMLFSRRALKKNAVESTVESTVRPAVESIMEPTAFPKLTACAVEHLGIGRSVGALRSGTLGHTLREVYI